MKTMNGQKINDIIIKKRKILLFSYGLGSIADGIVGILMVMAVFSGEIQFNDVVGSGDAFRFAMGWGASLMIGWSALLAWAAIKPFERRGTLLLTVIPTLSGLILTDILVLASGTTLTLIVQIILTIIFIYTYWTTHNMKNGGKIID
jgi:hypothetical protein